MGSAGSTTIKYPPSNGGGGAAPRRWSERAAQLYEQLRRPAAGMIRKAFGSKFADEEIEDIYSSAWVGTLRALERRHEELDDMAIRRYVLAAVANQANKEVRRRRRRPVAPLEAAGALVEVADGPEEAAAARETSQLTRDLLSSLPPRRRAVMLLRYGWGLEPKEICGMVKGLTPRAYRKEITRGVNELAAKVKLAEEGAWCAEREPVLKAYAAGLADRDQAIQAERHLAHCRHCTDFVGKLSGHLHDLGGAIVIPGALDALNGDVTFLERMGGVVERARDEAAGLLARGEGAAEVVAPIASGGGLRGAGAVGAGAVAKLAGLGAAGKAAVACLAGGAAATACIAAGIGPVAVGQLEPDRKLAVEERPDRGAGHVGSSVDAVLNHAANSVAPVVSNHDERAPAHRPDSEPKPVAPLAPSAPPVEQEFGVGAAASTSAPRTSTTSAPAPTQGGEATPSDVQQEFGL